MPVDTNRADWRAGYATTLDYTAGHYPFLCPEHLNYTCLLHGVEPPTLERDYDYFELGCGHGRTVGLLAAGNPRARFHANDFMPSHVAAGRQLAREAGLDNLTLLEHSFEDLAAGTPALPTFDYITMQGVYTWVAPEIRRQIVRFIGQRLKPGGVVAVGYNAMPGWAASLAVGRWLQAGSAWPTAGAAGGIDAARVWLQRLADASPEAFSGNAAMERRLAQIAKASPAYLQHEYLPRHWQPMYHFDVADDLAAAKLDFVGSAMLPSFWMSMPPEQQALIEAIPDPRWRETAKDYLLGTSFRTDVFVRGRRELSPARRRLRLAEFSVALTAPADQAASALARSSAPVAQAAKPILTRLAGRPHRFDELDDAMASVGLPEQAQTLAAMLSMNRHASIFRADAQPGDGRGARAWNDSIAADALHGGAGTALAAAVTGSGIDTDPAGLAIYRQLSGGATADPAAVVERAFLDLQGAETPLEHESLRQRLSAVLEDDLPIWRRLGAL